MADEWHERGALKARVDVELKVFVDHEVTQLIAVDEQLTPLAEQLRKATEEGKRLRAAFCYWGWRAAGQPDSDAMVRAATAMELVHAAAVVHDDIIDNSPVRRGAPTAHIALRETLSGPAERKAGGRALAMLAGDLLMSWAGQLFTSCGLPGAYLARARAMWATLARELVAGEALEILRTGSPPRADSSLQVIRYKTAKYTVEHPLHIGGRLAGAGPSLLETFSSYGLPLGEAFQLRDDLLGVFGAPHITGKSNLDDLAGHKPTALLAVTWPAATPAEREILRGLLGSRSLDQEGLEQVRDIMRRTGSVTRIEALIAERVRAATSAVTRAGLPPPAARALTGLIDSAVSRHS
ncbi:polyprenyl synthetase family protein [Streptomyces sp. AK02-01A]|uniref:polyprenyl synthetase family protein n=1 Tax=Streptomyces sp. AK02-01A TaxID=3028648 RepID=UPI0029BCFAE4|nr:polyprenyl synthetase family protein [Streptomyces sp. AK02-01A]MDX3850760.1 polyprenyl synthetase family protein [Streptomyces sp. AK02-01A]